MVGVAWNPQKPINQVIIKMIPPIKSFFDMFFKLLKQSQAKVGGDKVRTVTQF
jgi:hypothetical protein